MSDDRPANTPRDRLRQVALLLEDHEPGHLAAWFCAAVQAFETGTARSLDLALGLRGRGIELPPRTLARAARNEALTRAWMLFPDRPDETIAARGRRFTAWLADFGVRRWPRLRTQGRPPASALDEAARDAFAAADGQIPVPTSWDGLRPILLGE